MRETVNRSWAGALAVLAAHNLEETMAIASGWALHHLPRMAWTAEEWPLFAGAAAALTLTAGLVAWSLRNRPERSITWLRVFLCVLLLNAIWHAGVAAYTGAYAPGVATAVLLVLPCCTLILRKLHRAGHAA